MAGARSSCHSKASPVSPSACISARASSGFSRTPWTSPSSSRPESSSDRCAAAIAAGSAARSRSVTTNSAAARTRASTEATRGTPPAWHGHLSRSQDPGSHMGAAARTGARLRQDLATGPNSGYAKAYSCVAWHIIRCCDGRGDRLLAWVNFIYPVSRTPSMHLTVVRCWNCQLRSY